jgi:antirestriction protein ArdC
MATQTKARAKTAKADGPSAEQKIVDSLIAIIESGVSPWQKPWTETSSIPHQNITTGAQYSGGNPALLEFQMMARASALPLWAGFAQAKAKGWTVRKGAKGCYAIRPQLNSREETNDAGEVETHAWVSYKPVCLFNVSDLEGEGLQDAINAIIGTGSGGDEFGKIAAIEDAERVLSGWHQTTECKINFGGNRAFYVPALDSIQLPDRQAFRSAEGFYATWSHEVIHATGHNLRLKRDLSGGFGTPSYAREELVAELGAFLLTRRLGIGCEVENHASYLANWLTLLKEGPKMLFKVLADATKAANLVLPDSVNG